MKDILNIVKELGEHIRENKKWWLLPTLLTLIIFWLLLTSAGQSAVPVFIYPAV